MTISYENFEAINFDEHARGPDIDFEDLAEEDAFIVINEGLADPIDEFMEINMDEYDPVMIHPVQRSTDHNGARYNAGDFIGMTLIATYAVLVVYFGIFNWQPE